MDASDYQAWLRGGGQAVGQAGTPGVVGAGDTPESMAEAGQQLFQQFGCASCHRTDGNGPGPRLQGVFGSQVRLENGEIVAADEGYIRESIVDPNAKIVEGYTPIMPSYQGQLSEEQINQLVAYIRSLEEADGAEGPTGPATEDRTAQPAETTAPGTPATPAAP
jgi:cytochrome c oxidase subunit 2